ncbi:MAG TPA: hypothetical protein VFE62_26735 [Gemmataceae bacterium]|nr:hypothetical protein [Gemmataceae bacterium]
MSTRFIFISLSIMLLLGIPNVESVKEIQNLLDKTTVNTKGLTKKMKFKIALALMTDILQDKAPIYISKAALAVEPNLPEQEVALAATPAKVTARAALTQFVGQVAGGKAAFVVRQGYIEITTAAIAKKAK